MHMLVLLACHTNGVIISDTLLELDAGHHIKVEPTLLRTQVLENPISCDDPLPVCSGTVDFMFGS